MAISVDENTVKTEVLCKACGGRMKKAIVAKHSKKFGAILLVSGIVCSLFFIGLVLGIPLIFMGIYMVSAKRPIWMCPECRSIIERYEEESLRNARIN